MKAKYFFLLPVLCCFQLLAIAQEHTPTIVDNIVAVVRGNRVHILLDETPVKDLTILVRSQNGEIIFTQVFHTDDSCWYFDLPKLDAGHYTISTDGITLAAFDRKAPATTPQPHIR